MDILNRSTVAAKIASAFGVRAQKAEVATKAPRPERAGHVIVVHATKGPNRAERRARARAGYNVGLVRNVPYRKEA